MTLNVSIYSTKRNNCKFPVSTLYLSCLAQTIGAECAYMLIQYYFSPGEKLNTIWKWKKRNIYLVNESRIFLGQTLISGNQCIIIDLYKSMANYISSEYICSDDICICWGFEQELLCFHTEQIFLHKEFLRHSVCRVWSLLFFRLPVILYTITCSAGVS